MLVYFAVKVGSDGCRKLSCTLAIGEASWLMVHIQLRIQWGNLLTLAISSDACTQQKGLTLYDKARVLACSTSATGRPELPSSVRSKATSLRQKPLSSL